MKEDGREDRDKSGFAARKNGEDEPADDSDEGSELRVGISLRVLFKVAFTSIFPNPMLSYKACQYAFACVERILYLTPVHEWTPTMGCPYGRQ